MQGLIIESKSNLYKIKTQNKIYEAVPRGKLKNEELTPIVGDNVEFDITNEENKKAVIEKVLQRKVYVKRPKIANITQLVFVVSIKDPKPDLLMLDKQLAFAEFLKIKSLIILNKTDLDKQNKFEQIEDIYKKIGYKVIKTQAKELLGIEQLLDELKNNINAFSGNSGVGKSTLINAIFKNQITKEGEISQKNKKGKNTTTSINLYEIDDNTYIADTPGFSTFDISEIESKDLYNYFIEFANYANDCEYIGCTHIKEEKCGIKSAVKKGLINKSRYDNFCKIYNELRKKENRKW